MCIWPGTKKETIPIRGWRRPQEIPTRTPSASGDGARDQKTQRIIAAARALHQPSTRPAYRFHVGLQKGEKRPIDDRVINPDRNMPATAMASAPAGEKPRSACRFGSGECRIRKSRPSAEPPQALRTSPRPRRQCPSRTPASQLQRSTAEVLGPQDRHQREGGVVTKLIAIAKIRTASNPGHATT